MGPKTPLEIFPHMERKNSWTGLLRRAIASSCLAVSSMTLQALSSETCDIAWGVLKMQKSGFVHMRAK